MMTILIVSGAVLPWLLVGLGGWLGVQLIAQNGRIVLRLEALEARLAAAGTVPAPGPAAAAPAPEGLSVGAEAPAFALPDLDGRHHALADYHGRRTLLVFFGPRCGFCTPMIPRLAELARGGGAGQPVPLVVSSGSAEENRPLFREHGYGAPVLLQQGLEVASLYQAYGTPIGYLIDEQGRIASPMAVGADALLALAAAPSVPANGHATAKPSRGNRPLETSKLVRDGLKAGTPAPGFRLPRVDGGELRLESYRGRRVLLVFSDPQCGPCDALAPELERHHRDGAGAAILMISRREMEANRRKVAEHGLTFPVAVQKNWDVSKLYGMFATPIAYLIDERGILAADVAVGADAILALLSGGAPASERDGACLAETAV